MCRYGMVDVKNSLEVILGCMFTYGFGLFI